MTTINDISDLVRVLQERPDWLAAVRNLVVSEELLNLPQQVARFVEATEENFRQNRELIQQVREQIREIQKQNRLMYQQLDRLEGRTGNFDRAVYERV